MIYWRKMPEGLTRKEESAFAQMLLKDALKREYQLPALPEIERSSYGKPYFPAFPELYFNYSHSKDGAVCVLAKNSVGIDLEKVRSYREKTVKRFCNEKEWNWLQKQETRDKEWIRIWTVKEAYVKYTGIGIRTDLRCLDISDALKVAAGEMAVVEPEPGKKVYIQSFFKENFWLSVCSSSIKCRTICCI